MSDNEGHEPSRKKRSAERQITKDDRDDADDSPVEDPGSWEKAPDSVLAGRKRFKAKRSTPATPAAAETASTTPNAAANPPLPVFGSFVFGLPSATKPDVAADAKAASPEKAASTGDKTDAEKPASIPAFSTGFGGFTFPSALTPTTAPSAAKATDSDSKPGGFQFAPSIFSSSGPSSFNFSFQLNTAAPPDMKAPTFSFDATSIKTFAQDSSTLKVFGKDIQKPAEPVGASQPDEGDGEDEADPTQNQPTQVVEPDVTGEEDEETLFQERCKLYEFNKEASQWIEKGLGKLKLNKSKVNAARVRLLMRTEPAHRLAINGILTAGLPINVDPKRKKVLNLTLPAAYVMGHDAATATAVSILSIRFQDDSHASALKDLIIQSFDAAKTTEAPEKVVEKSEVDAKTEAAEQEQKEKPAESAPDAK